MAPKYSMKNTDHDDAAQTYQLTFICQRHAHISRINDIAARFGFCEVKAVDRTVNHRLSGNKWVRRSLARRRKANTHSYVHEDGRTQRLSTWITNPSRKLWSPYRTRMPHWSFRSRTPLLGTSDFHKQRTDNGHFTAGSPFVIPLFHHN